MSFEHGDDIEYAVMITPEIVKWLPGKFVAHTLHQTEYVIKNRRDKEIVLGCGRVRGRGSKYSLDNTNPNTAFKRLSGLVKDDF